MWELVRVEADGEVEFLDFGTEAAMNADRLDMIEDSEINDETPSDLRVVPADTRNCPGRKHTNSHHATVCLAQEWSNGE
jgi:hypothetical protein